MERMKGRGGRRLWGKGLGLLRGRLVGFEGMMKWRRRWTNGRGIVSIIRHRFSWGRTPITEGAYIEYAVACHRHLSTKHSNQPLNIQVFAYSAPNLLSTSHFLYAREWGGRKNSQSQTSERGEATNSKK
jgi:hypothetical protein